MGVAGPVRVPSASATADVGGASWVGDRRTTVRGGRTVHDDGSCGGFAPLAGSGGATDPAEERAGDHAARAGPPADDLRTVAPGGTPTVGATAPSEPGTPARENEPESNGRPPAPPGTPVVPGLDATAPAVFAPVPTGVVPAPLLGRPVLGRPPDVLAVPGSVVVDPADVPVALADALGVPADALVALADVLVALADVLVALAEVLVAPAGMLVALAELLVAPADVLVGPADGDPARRRTGDAAERIDAPAADAPPAAATTVGDMERSASPGPASTRCWSPPTTPGLPASAGFRALDVRGGAARFAEAYTAAGPVGGA